MGDEIATASVPSNGTSGPPMGANEDLLSQIFGGGAPASAGPAPSAPASKQKAIDDVLGLFGPSGGATARPTSPVPAPSMASHFGQTAAPDPAPTAISAAQPPAPQRAQGYAAHEKERTADRPPTAGFCSTTRSSTCNCMVRSYWTGCYYWDQVSGCGA